MIGVGTTYVGRLCFRCMRISWHADDLSEGYCARCRDWTAGQRVELPRDQVDRERSRGR